MCHAHFEPSESNTYVGEKEMWNHRKCIQEAVFSRPRSQSFTGPDLNATFEALPCFPHLLRIMQNIFKEEHLQDTRVWSVQLHCP